MHVHRQKALEEKQKLCLNMQHVTTLREEIEKEGEFMH